MHKNKYTFFFTLLLFLVACSTVQKKSVDKKKHLFISPSKNVSVHCTAIDKENKNSFTYLYVFGKKRIDSFIYRRPWSYEQCLKEKAIIKKILKKNNNVKVTGLAGILNNANDFETDDTGYKPINTKNIPHFTWFFDKIKGRKKCHGYFSLSCK